MNEILTWSIVPKCVGCNNIVVEGPEEMPSETTCCVFACPKHRFSDTVNCLHASHLKNDWGKKKTGRINPLKASKKAAKAA